jgi:hypothetical protein
LDPHGMVNGFDMLLRKGLPVVGCN